MSFVYKNNPLNDGTYVITSNFGYRNAPKTSTGYGSSQHKGIDLGTYGGAAVAIHSVSDGVVKTAEYDPGYGNYVVIDHGNGVETRYAHMANPSPLTVGQSISAGTQVGNVGSTGNSSGPHLHFEIRVNGNPVDPAPYINSGGATMLSPEFDTSISNNTSGDSSGEYQGSIGVVGDIGGVTVGQRVADVTTQPIHAYVNIYVGENQLLLSTEPPKPNILQSFEFTRLDGAGETAIITLFDDNWEELEAVLSANSDNIYIEYGYYGSGKKSKLYKHLLLNYNISFVSTGTILSVESTTEGVVKNLTSMNMVLDTYNPTEAVRKICENLGYDLVVADPSSDITADDPFNLVEDFPITYIQEVIIPQASKEGEELFSFDIDETTKKAYFRREGYNTISNDLRTYIYQKGYDSSVIDFTVDIKGVFGGNGTFQIATEYRSSVFDKDTKSQESYKADKASVVTAATGDKTATHHDQSNPVIDSSAYTPSQMKNRLYYHMKTMQYDSYEATLTIVGDPTVELHEFIRVINVTDKGYLHHTSGVYWVEGITDSIQGGSMVTVLKLIKNAVAGDIDGLEIINPKLQVK